MQPHELGDGAQRRLKGGSDDGRSVRIKPGIQPANSGAGRGNAKTERPGPRMRCMSVPGIA
eukprot:2061633-Rhodomonas_salina.4